MTLIDLPTGSFLCGPKSVTFRYPNSGDCSPSETKISINPRWVMSISEVRWQEQTYNGWDPAADEAEYSYTKKIGVKILMRDDMMYFVPNMTRDQLDAALAEQGGD